MLTLASIVLASWLQEEGMVVIKFETETYNYACIPDKFVRR